jgi:hypothetical protein
VRACFQHHRDQPAVIIQPVVLPHHGWAPPPLLCLVLQGDGVAREVFVGAVHATAPLRDFIKLHLVPPPPLSEEEGSEEEIFNSLLAVVTGRHHACLMRLWQRLAGDSPALQVGGGDWPADTCCCALPWWLKRPAVAVCFGWCSGVWSAVEPSCCAAWLVP